MVGESPTPESAVRVFVSYRHGSRGATRLVDRLKVEFGEKSVFRDVLDIPYGADFSAVILDYLAATSVVVVVLDRRWRIKRRDWMRFELSQAKLWDIPVLPVLVDGAKMPDQTRLRGVEWLARHHASHLRSEDPDFRNDVGPIVARIRELGSQPIGRRDSSGAIATPPDPKAWWPKALGIALVVVALAALGWWVARPSSGSSMTTTTTVSTAPEAPGDRLSPNEVLRAGGALTSRNGRHVLTMTEAGVLELRTDGSLDWSSSGRGIPGSSAQMQGDGNLVIHPPDGAQNVPDPVWSAQSCCHPNAYLMIGENDDGSGYIAIYSPDGKDQFLREPPSTHTSTATTPATTIATTSGTLTVPSTTTTTTTITSPRTPSSIISQARETVTP
jgi:hypothetical protein